MTTSPKTMNTMSSSIIVNPLRRVMGVGLMREW